MSEPDPLDILLDDLIRKRELSGWFNADSRHRNSGPGPSRRRFIRKNSNPVRTTPYPITPVIQSSEAMLEGQMLRIRRSRAEEETKVYISNLDYGVSDSDLEILFSDLGDLKQYSIHYDKSGRSKGTAEVVFLHFSDALGAIKRYNNIALDGKPLKLELVGVDMPCSTVRPRISSLGNSYQTFPSGQRRTGFRARTHDDDVALARAGRRGRSLDGRRGRSLDEKLTVEDLDTELETYRLEAMQIN